MNKNKILVIVLIFTALLIVFIKLFTNRMSYHSIRINESKWDYIISSRNENTNLRLGDLKFNDYPLIIDEVNNTLYYSLVNSSKTKYSPAVSFKSFDKHMKIAVLEDEITDEKIEAKHPFQVMIYNASEYHIYQLICTNFPVLNIHYDAGSPKKKNIPMKVYLFNNLSNTAHRIMRSDGRLSVIDDKNEGRKYTFSLFAMSPGRNERENRISIFNMDPHSEYTLRSAEPAAEENSPAAQNAETQTQLVELFMNNEYSGLYSLESSREKK